MSHRWALLFLVAFLEGCVAMGSGRTKPELPAGEILYIRGADLWIQSLDSGRHRPLTSSGKVMIEPAGHMPSGWRGVAISPDGKQVAYVENHPPDAPGSSQGRVGRWNMLFVVNADGTGRRKLVDLTRQRVPEGQYVRAGRFLWSDDGKSIAYVLASSPMKVLSGTCADVTFHSVDVASGRGTSLFEAHPLDDVTLLGWSPARAELAFHDGCGFQKGDEPSPIPKGRVTLVRVSDRKMRQRYALHPSMSPDGTFVFIPLQPDVHAPPALYRTEELGGAPAVPIALPAGHEGRIHWLHHAPAALISSTEWELPFLECVGTRPQPRMLFWLELGTGTLRRVREDAHVLNVVAISPGDTYALVGIITGVDKEFLSPRCGVELPVEQLFLVRLEDLASELPIEEILRRAKPLTPPRVWSDVHPFAEYVGWVR
ncbi:hypothetical protein F0U59_11520 [Archangium gephyra]|nr:hypothetical protein F0U59_11520 [Archangium gephyra]